MSTADLEMKSAEAMDLRDYFAAKAMSALITGPDVMANHYDDCTNEYVAQRAYIIADAMLEARLWERES